MAETTAAGTGVRQYVAGILFNVGYSNLVLVEKQRPVTQRHKLNAIGGEIKDGETPHAAMVREFKEEAGLEIGQWSNFCTLHTAASMVHFFCATYENISAVREQTDERLFVIPVDSLQPYATVPDIPWLVRMAMPHCKHAWPYKVQEKML